MYFAIRKEKIKINLIAMAREEGLEPNSTIGFGDRRSTN